MAETDDPMQTIRDFRTDIDFARIATEESKRTYVTADPVVAVELEALAAAHGVDHLMKVQCSPFVPAGYVVVMDEQAMQAGFNESLQHWRPFRDEGTS